jgi:hypothetical protein
MDRDMVNCLHYLYQWGSVSAEQRRDWQSSERLFWCPFDTSHPLIDRKIIIEDGSGGPLRLAEGMIGLLDMFEQQVRSMPKPDFAFGYPFSAAIRNRGSVRPAFLAIPYADEFEEVQKTVEAAAKAAQFNCEVTGDLKTSREIMDHVWTGIRRADVVIADITRQNANVFYEIGLAHALGKEVILLSQDPEAPFDIRAHRRITYRAEDLASLAKELEEAFRAVSARYPHEGPEPRF